MSRVILFGLRGLAVFLFAHVAWWRLRPSNQPRIYFLFGLMAAASLCSAVWLWRDGGNDLESQATLLSFNAMIYMSYMYFYGAVCRSVSMTLLTVVLDDDSGRMPVQKLQTIYASSSRFEDRLRVMQEMGWITADKDHVQLTEKGRRLVQQISPVTAALSGRLEG